MDATLRVYLYFPGLVRTDAASAPSICGIICFSLGLLCEACVAALGPKALSRDLLN